MPTSVLFNAVPVDTFVPYVYVEFDNSRALSRIQGTQPYRALLIGPRRDVGTKPALEPLRVGTAAEAADYFGIGSVLSHMFAAFFRNNRETEAYGIGVDDALQAVKAKGSITIAGEPTAAGVLSVMIGGRWYRVPVKAKDLAVTVAEAIHTLLESDTERVVDVATDAPGSLQLTARPGGEVGNAIDLHVSYLPGESLPKGLTVTIEPMKGGALNPDMKPVVLAMADEWFNVIGMAFTDDTSLGVIEAELADRWGPVRPIDGHAFIASALSAAELSTTFKARNSPHLTVVAATDSPTPPWEWAAAVAGVNAREAQRDPARPYQTLPLIGIVPPKKSMNLSIRDMLLKDGIATTTFDQSRVVRIERLVTTYKKNSNGAVDASYRDIMTKQTLSFLRWDFRNHFMTKFARHKLADDGTRFAAGQLVLTPKTAKAEAIAKFSEWEERALVENADQFKRELVVERSRQDPNRLDFLLPPDLINQLMVTAIQIGWIV